MEPKVELSVRYSGLEYMKAYDGVLEGEEEEPSSAKGGGLVYSSS
jgi:hypothetical protein